MYQLTTSTSIKRLSDGAFIPNDPGNRDYREYLDWVEAGNTPEPAPAPPPPPPSYAAFWDALLASTVYGSIRTQSMASLPMNTLATEFIALLGDAKAGRPNESAIQASMSAVFSTGAFTEDDAEEFTDALAGLLTWTSTRWVKLAPVNRTDY
jgi:hypothetical protein